MLIHLIKYIIVMPSDQELGFGALAHRHRRLVSSSERIEQREWSEDERARDNASSEMAFSWSITILR